MMFLNREQEKEADQSDCDRDLAEEPCVPDLPDLERADREMSADRQAVSAETDDQVGPSFTKYLKPFESRRMNLDMQNLYKSINIKQFRLFALWYVSN